MAVRLGVRAIQGNSHMQSSILLGKGTQEIRLSARMANRHGLVAGATGTGKTVTLRVLAEGFSRLGVPVFMADVKGDLSGMAMPGDDNPKFQERASELGVPDYRPCATPVVLWDVFGQQGIAVRATVSEMGPLVLARLLNLNETQSGVLNVVFKVADVEQMLLLDLKDLQSMLEHVSQHAKEYSTAYGNISAASVAAIQRGLLTLEQQGAVPFFGEPALELDDLMRTEPSGQGVVNILAADKLMAQPKTYATVLLWLLTKLFDELPEVGDLERPKLVFFFDEAHLLFAGAPKVVLEKVEQLVRLIRSKGVGVYFVSQNPLDIPDTVLGQLGNRVQHALRAFTPRDRKAVKAAAQTFRSDDSFDVEQAITELAVGEALVSLLDDSGTPTPVERVKIAPPESRLGPLSETERRQIIRRSELLPRYETPLDRQSAYELLQKRAKRDARWGGPKSKAGGPRRRGGVETVVTSTARSFASQLARSLVRWIIDSLRGSRR